MFHSLGVGILFPVFHLASATAVLEESADSAHGWLYVGLIMLVTAAFMAIHLWSAQLHRWLYRSEAMATSFSAGMAIAYVFMHLLPELDKGEALLGELPIHVTVLVGFLLFYGLQRWAWRRSELSQWPGHRGSFWVHLGFVSLYNFLLLFSIPEKLVTQLPFIVVYVVAIGLHLLSTDHALREEYGHLFVRWGRYILCGALAVGGVATVAKVAVNEQLSGILIALLSGFLIFKIFREELPSHQQTHFRWFLAGTTVYVVLLAPSWLLGG